MVPDEPTIEFRLDRASGMPAYRQIVDQVRRSLRLGLLQPGDQLPTVRDVVRRLAINPNTVHRAYRDLEQLGLAEGRRGSGTFVVAPPVEVSGREEELFDALRAWVAEARSAGVDDETIEAMVAGAMGLGAGRPGDDGDRTIQDGTGGGGDGDHDESEAG
jgi:GntR family transcriptional regulator